MSSLLLMSHSSDRCMWGVPLQDLSGIWHLVIHPSNPDFFFYILSFIHLNYRYKSRLRLEDWVRVRGHVCVCVCLTCSSFGRQTLISHSEFWQTGVCEAVQRPQAHRQLPTLRPLCVCMCVVLAWWCVYWSAFLFCNSQKSACLENAQRRNTRRVQVCCCDGWNMFVCCCCRRGNAFNALMVIEEMTHKQYFMNLQVQKKKKCSGSKVKQWTWGRDLIKKNHI